MHDDKFKKKIPKTKNIRIGYRGCCMLDRSKMLVIMVTIIWVAFWLKYVVQSCNPTIPKDIYKRLFCPQLYTLVRCLQ